MNATAAPRPISSSECDCCSAPTTALAVPDRDEARCPACHESIRRFTAADEHLRALLTSTLHAWRDHWAAQGLTSQEMRELTWFISVEEALDPLLEPKPKR